MFSPNLLVEANDNIPFEEFEYIEFDKEEINEIGIKVPSYKDAIKLKGSIQPIESNLYQQLNLDFQKEYIKVWTLQKINTILNKEYADKIIYNNTTYEVIKIQQWNNYNGWCEIVAIKEGNNGN